VAHPAGERVPGTLGSGCAGGAARTAPGRHRAVRGIGRLDGRAATREDPAELRAPRRDFEPLRLCEVARLRVAPRTAARRQLQHGGVRVDQRERHLDGALDQRRTRARGRTTGRLEQCVEQLLHVEHGHVPGLFCVSIRSFPRNRYAKESERVSESAEGPENGPADEGFEVRRRRAPQRAGRASKTAATGQAARFEPVRGRS